MVYPIEDDGGNPGGTIKFGGIPGGKGGGTIYGGGGGGGKREQSVAALEAELAEVKKKNKALKETRNEAGNLEDEGDGKSNAGNPALDSHGGTHHRFKGKH